MDGWTDGRTEGRMPVCLSICLFVLQKSYFMPYSPIIKWNPTTVQAGQLADIKSRHFFTVLQTLIHNSSGMNISKNGR